MRRGDRVGEGRVPLSGWWRLRLAAVGLALLTACQSDEMGGSGAACFPNATCLAGLTCLSNRCVELPDGGAATPDVGPASDLGETRYQMAAVYFAGARQVTGGGALPCAWINEHNQGDGDLLVGVDASERIVGASIVRRDDRCELSPETTARVLVTTALGGLLSTPAERTALWGSTAELDVRDITEVIRAAGSLETALTDSARAASINASLGRIDRELAAAAAARRFGVAPDPLGFDELTFGTPTLASGNRSVEVAVTAGDQANEVKALVVGDTVRYIKGDNVIDLYGFIYPDEAARATATLQFPVGTSSRGVTRVLASSAITGPFQNPSTTIREELIYNNVLGRTLTAHMLHALTAFIPDVADLLRRNVGCARELFNIAQPLVQSAVQSVLQRRSFSSAAQDLVVEVLQAITEESLRFTAACHTDADTQRVIGRFVVIARAVGYLGQGIHNVWDASTGPYLAQHTVDFCAACPGAREGMIPACLPRDGALVCQSGSCDIAQVGTQCEAGRGECRRTGTRDCVGGALACSARAAAPQTEVCGNGRDEDCDGSDLMCPRPCAGDTSLGSACSAGDGACRRAGTFACDSRTNMVACSATAGMPGEEVCNGIDDNCNRSVDESLTQGCYTGPAGTRGVGACRSGTQSCAAGAWGVCAGQVTPRAEVCGNGADDDCDGSVDDGCVSCADDFCYRGAHTSGAYCDGGQAVTCSVGAGGCAVEATRTTCPDGCQGGACRSCASNFCRQNGYTSGPHCNGTALVQCGTNASGCAEVVSQMSCPAGCASDRCVNCASNACQSLARTSGSFCSGSEQVDCGAVGACATVLNRAICSNGCDAATGRCIECTSNYCQNMGLRSGTYCDGNNEITCGVYGGCGAVSFQRSCGSQGCSSGRCNACASNWCQTNGQSSGAWCDGSSVVRCATDGPCRVEASRSYCPGGCTGGMCGMTTTRVFQQSYDSSSLFNDLIDGPQRFTDGEQFVDACGTSSVRFGSSYQGASALNFYCRCGGSASNTTQTFPAPARADETLRVRFWAYNPLVSTVQIGLQRAGGVRSTLAVASQEWTQLSVDLRSSLSTSDVILFLGDLPASGGGFTFRIDEVTIDRF